ncbi:hypothetical protein KCU81_g3912, partial [Aureobasidium melanogenum]
MALFRKLTQRSKSRREETPTLADPQPVQQATLQEENYGLFEVSDAAAGNDGSVDEESMRQVDIVAVHGLMGHWENTWNAGNSHEDAMFLRDRVPADLSRNRIRARIFSYGYDSAVFSRSVVTIDQAADMLLERLLGKRKKPEEKCRPIIFIAHSLGGLVVKQAMIQAWSHSQRYNELLDSVKGCLFLGVPHGGADSAYWANLPAQMIPYVTLGLRGNPRFLRSLESKSADCVRISRDFVHRAVSLRIRTFYETEKLGTIIVVDRSSATLNLPNEVAVPLDGSNHVTICKFSASENQRYEPIKDAIEELVIAGLGTTQTKWNMPLKSDMPSSTDTFCGRETELQRMTEALRPAEPRQTDDSDLTNPRPNGLVLYGIGGSGKTQLALRYIQKHGSLYKAIVWINASDTQNLEASFAEAADLLSGWPENTAPRSSTATPQNLVIGKLCDTRSSPWLLVIDSVDDLSQHNFRACIPNCGHGSVIVTSTRANASEVFRIPESLEIDYLDQSSGCQLLLKIVGGADIPETDWAAQIVKELHGIPLAIEHAGVLIRTSLSPEQFLESYQERYIWLMTKYPDRGIISYDKDRSIIAVFELLFQDVKSRYPEAGALLVFLAILGTWKIPTTFLNQYQRFLPGIRSEVDHESQHLVEALSTPEALQFALSHLVDACLVKRDPNRDHSRKSIELHRAIRDWSLQTSMRGKQVWLIQATRGLVAATLNYVEQTTHSLQNLQQTSTLDRSFLAHLRQCVALLHKTIPANEILPPFGRYCRQYAELVGKLAEIDLSCGLLSEADQNFTVAIEYQRTKEVTGWPDSRADLVLLEGLAVVRYRSADFDSCIEILETAMRLAERLYGKFDPEVVAITSYSKDVSEKRERMQQHHKNVILAVSGSKMNNPSAELPEEGYQGEIAGPSSYSQQQTLSDEHQIEDDEVNTYLREAVSRGSSAKGTYILSNQNSQDEFISTAQSWAYQRLQVDPQDELGLIARSLASNGRHEELVHLLLENDQIDVNARDIFGSTPLEEFSGLGYHKIVHMLLTRGADVNALSGEYGNALQAASAHGHDKIVQMLLEHNADVNAQGGKHGNALQAASRKGHDKIVRMLLSRDARITTETFYHLFASQRGPPLLSSLSCIQKGTILEKDPDNGKTLLHLAAENGRTSVIERCLELGAEVNATDVSGRTALHYAARNGHVEVVKILVQAKADRTMLDNDKQSALVHALRAGADGPGYSRRFYLTMFAQLWRPRVTNASIYSEAISAFRKKKNYR